MAPRHIDDPAATDENRQLMFGLIDDLPEERKDTRQWLGLAGVALSFRSGSRPRERLYNCALVPQIG